MTQETEDGQKDLGKQDKIGIFPESCRMSVEQARLLGILDNIPSAVVVLEKPRGLITFVNKRAVELYGFNPCGLKLEEFGAAIKIYTSEGVPCTVTKLYSFRTLFNEETILNELEIIDRKDGKRLVITLSGKPLYDEKGKVEAAVIIFDDATERVKTQNALQESESRLKMAQGIAHVGSWEYYSAEDKAIWSDELFRMFGLKPQKYGPTTTEYVTHIHPEDREMINQKMEKLLFHARVYAKTSFDYRIIRPDGSTRIIHSERMVRELSKDGKPARIVGIEQDITERKQIEEQLETYAKHLEKLVAERTKQLKDAERLAAIGQTAGMIGHDIRNPLQTISGELFLIKQETDAMPEGSIKANIQESVATLQDQSSYISKIITDLQDYARPLKPELVDRDVEVAIAKILSTVSAPNNIKVRFESEEGLSARVDVTFLTRILVNLVNNAIQAMPNGGKLSLKAVREGDHVGITVSDTGVGIPEEVKPRIFQPLMTTKSKGQGFGLAVVKRLVEAQGGAVSFESQVGIGTKFKITLPSSKK